MIQINESNFDEETREGVVVLDFYADWCGPCKMLTPVLEEVIGAKVGKVDIDKENDLAAKFKVSAVPTLLFFKDGLLMDRVVGIQTLQALQAKIDVLNSEG